MGKTQTHPVCNLPNYLLLLWTRPFFECFFPCVIRTAEYIYDLFIVAFLPTPIPFLT